MVQIAGFASFSPQVFEVRNDVQSLPEQRQQTANGECVTMRAGVTELDVTLIRVLART